MLSVSPRSGKGRPKKAPKAAGTARNGIEVPRLETARYGGSSYGPLVASWAARNLGIQLYPWQLHVLSGMLEHDGPADDAFGRLRHRTAAVSCARQNGKSEALKALIGWALTDCAAIRGQAQTVISTAHSLPLATKLFRELEPVLTKNYRADAVMSYGRVGLRLPDGSSWNVQAATPSAGHGFSTDWIFADETWRIPEDVIDHGFLPTMRARPQPLFVSWSTAGTEESTWLQRIRDAGIRLVASGKPGSLYFAEYSVDPGRDDINDPSTWGKANPSLGHGITLETLIEESKAPNRSAFLRAGLNLWIAAESAWLPPGTWDSNRADVQLPPIAVLAVDLSLDGMTYSGVAAGIDPDGRIVLSVPFQVQTSGETWDKIEELLPATATLAVSPSLEIHVPPRIRPRTTTVGYAELTRWTGLVEQMIGEGRVIHRGDLALADHMARAVAVRTKTGKVLSSQKSPGPIELARLAIFAAALCSTPKASGKPALGTSRRRPAR